MGEYVVGEANSPETPSRRLSGSLRRQFGNVTPPTGGGLGLGASKRGSATGRLSRATRGLFHAPARQDPPALIAAAVLAGGPAAVASHASAAWLWGFVPHYEPPPQISLPTGDRRPRHIHTHRCPSLAPRDLTRQHGVPTTTPARTVLDLAPRLTKKPLTRLVNDQRRDGRLRLAALDDLIARNPLHPGTKLLRPFIDNPRNPTASPFEDDFLTFVTKYGLPMPQTNVWLHGRNVDAYFPEAGLIIELDGRDFHNDQDAFRDDRERDTENLKHGLTTIRMTTDRLKLTRPRGQTTHGDPQPRRAASVSSGRNAVGSPTVSASVTATLLKSFDPTTVLVLNLVGTFGGGGRTVGVWCGGGGRPRGRDHARRAHRPAAGDLPSSRYLAVPRGPHPRVTVSVSVRGSGPVAARCATPTPPPPWCSRQRDRRRDSGDRRAAPHVRAACHPGDHRRSPPARRRAFRGAVASSPSA